MIYQARTRVFRIAGVAIPPQILSLAAETLLRGGLVAFPTETVYGLGANARDAEAVSHIFAAKERPFADPLIVHIASFDQLRDVAADIPPIAYRLAEAFWPGPLTMVLKRGENIPGTVSAGTETVAVRYPAHPVPQALIRAAGVPVAAPSANRFSRPSPTTAQHVLEDLDGRVDVILDGGPCPIGVESTVLNLLSAPPMILRPGGLTLEKLQIIIPDVSVGASFQLSEEEHAVSPGLLLKHYSPQAQVMVFRGNLESVCRRMQAEAEALVRQGRRVGVMVAEEEASCFAGLPVLVVSLGPRDRLDQVAATLFSAMRELDRQAVNVILVGTFSLGGLGMAIRDRLLRAAEGRVIDADAG